MNRLKQSWSVLSIALVVVAVAAVGCTSNRAAATHTSTHTPAKSSVAPADVGAAYVETINKLCSKTKSDVVEIVPSGYSAATSVAVLLKQAPGLRKIYRAFDRQLAKVAVPPAGKTAAAAMRGYVATSDATKRKAIAAATKSQGSYRAEYNRQLIYWGSGAGAAVLAKRDAAGISQDCNYR
jgi:hypothetical protein